MKGLFAVTYTVRIWHFSIKCIVLIEQTNVRTVILSLRDIHHTEL